MDISFDVANGPEAAAVTRELMEHLPAMRPLVMLLKVFLQQRELNEVGGCGCKYGDGNTDSNTTSNLTTTHKKSYHYTGI